eukprot:COSAG02_NODE_59608_length_274_cov_0.382857_1_plen_45_part_10
MWPTNFINGENYSSEEERKTITLSKFTSGIDLPRGLWRVLYEYEY